MDGDQQQVIRNEETVVAGQPETDQTVVSQTQRAVGNPPVAGVASDRSAVQTTTTTAATPPSDQVVSHNVAERVVDPAADRAAGVDWATRFVWFVVGVMAALIAIRFVLLLTGANESAGFAQLIYGLTGWMVAPFAGLFGANITYPGAAGTGIFEPGSLVAIIVYVLVGWGITKLAELMLGTNRTTGTVYQDTERRTKL
ncbi:MAG: hypothetical protein ACJ78Q_06845 [Chloroflexia bacterium]